MEFKAKELFFMIKDIITLFMRACLQMVLWVFILSFSWEGRSLFDRAHEIIIDNELVESLDKQIGQIWYEVSEAAWETFSNLGQGKNKNL